MTPKHLEGRIQALSVLVVEDNSYMRRLIRNLLTTIGVKQIAEAVDGIEGLEAIRMVGPDVVLLDWVMPLLGGAEVVRIVRSPGVFPTLGVNEYLVKPVSPQALCTRLVAVMTNPRPTVQRDGYYGPEPRRLLPEAVDKWWEVPTEP